jgi:Na+-driven multidrug efflux pump
MAGIISTLFTGVGAVIIGIFLGFVVALIIGAIIYGIVKLRERWQKQKKNQ